jgi:hypothetical protein
MLANDPCFNNRRVVAAPIAAKLAGRLPKKTSFLLLGVLVIIWSIKILSKLL